MARPVHIICSANSSTDRETGQTSLFQIIDKVHIRTPPDSVEGIKLIVIQKGMHVNATWMAEPERGDAADSTYEQELRLIHPDGGVSPILQSRFKFMLNDNKRFIRLTVRIPGPPPFNGSGVYSMESRIRKEGNSDWTSQSCPLWVDLDELSAR